MKSAFSRFYKDVTNIECSFVNVTINKVLLISIDTQTHQSLRKNVIMIWVNFQTKSVKFKSGPIDGAV